MVMVQAANGLGLALESLDIVGVRAANDLDSHIAMHEFVMCEIYLRHATASQATHEPVATELRSFQTGHTFYSTVSVYSTGSICAIVDACQMHTTRAGASPARTLLRARAESTRAGQNNGAHRKRETFAKVLPSVILSAAKNLRDD